MNYKNKFCPVCKSEFKENDDIVVCPECGTPHHRECWFKGGKCANFSLHGEETEKIISTYKKEEITEEYKEIPSQEPVLNDEKASEEDEIKKNIEDFAEKVFSSDENNSNGKKSFLIDGRESVLYEIAVGKNQRYYMPRFIALSQFKKNLLSFNLMACFFPMAWSVYRKLYKFAAAFLAFYLAVFGITFVYASRDGKIAKQTEICIQEDVYCYENIINYFSGEDAVLTKNQQNLVKEIENHTLPQPAAWAIKIISSIIKVLYAVSVNKIYMKEIGKTIDKGKSLGYTDDKLKAFIYRKKNVFPFFLCIILGYIESFLSIF